MTERPAILIIEDNERNLKLVRDILNHVGYPTLEAANAEDGLALAHAERPRLILMDIQLPDMDGVEALGVLRRDPATAGACVVALTAFAMNADRERFLAAGFDGYLEKPLNVPEFPAQVAALLGRVPGDATT